MVLWLVDAHTTYQSGLNIEKLAEEGYSGIIVKATQGSTGYRAPSKFNDWIRRARSVGLVPGAYHWLTSSNGVNQAEYYLDRISEVGGHSGLIIAIDDEDVNNPAPFSVLYDFITTLRKTVGQRQLLYYSGGWWAKVYRAGVNLASLGLLSWNSRYVSGSGFASSLYRSVPESFWTPGYGGWSTSTMLQFSSSGTAGGITANVDVNAFNGSRGQLLTLTGTGGATMSFTPEQIEAQQFNADNNTKVLLSHLPEAHELPGDGSTTGVPRPNVLAQRIDSIKETAEATLAAVTNIGAPELPPEFLEVLRGDVRTAVESAVGQRLGNLDKIVHLLDALGSAGDVLGKLNDPTPTE